MTTLTCGYCGCGFEDDGSYGGQTCPVCRVAPKTCVVCKGLHYRTGKRTCGSVACMSKNLANAKRRRARRDRESCLRDLGLVKVKGALGGTYWE